MGSEIKTKGKKVEVITSTNLHRQFKSHCKKLNVSISQRLRDLMQKDLKARPLAS